MSNRRILKLCADDFGLSEGIDRAIIDLIDRRRLSATSCMVAGRSIAASASALSARRPAAEIGLHITLTDLAPLGPMPVLAPHGQPPALAALLRKAFAGGLDVAEVRAEIVRQADRFRQVFGHAPDFVDGHQHVHLFPGIRAALWQCFRDGTLPRTAAVRNCHEPVASILSRGVEVPKTLFLSVLSSGVAGTARGLGVPTNDSFRGVTAFATDHSFGSTFARFLSGPGRRPLAMCHPGLPGYPIDPTDVIAEARTQEYAYLAGDQFSADLAAAGTEIGMYAEA